MVEFEKELEYVVEKMEMELTAMFVRSSKAGTAGRVVLEAVAQDQTEDSP